MNQLINRIEKEVTLSSLEVAEMIGKRHDNLLADIREYIKEFSLLNFKEREYFIESTYKNRGKHYPCYDITKKGCEFIAHKLTGIKGTEFTVKYIDRFHDMEDYIKSDEIANQNTEKFLMCLQGVKFLSDDMKLAESSRLFMYNGAFKEFGLPTSFLPQYEDNESRERCSATELLKRNGCGIKVPAFNKLMIEKGYIELKDRKSSKGETKQYKALTEKGLEYGVNLICNKNQKESQPYYYTDTFMELYNIIFA